MGRGRGESCRDDAILLAHLHDDFLLDRVGALHFVAKDVLAGIDFVRLAVETLDENGSIDEDAHRQNVFAMGIAGVHDDRRRRGFELRHPPRAILFDEARTRRPHAPDELFARCPELARLAQLLRSLVSGKARVGVVGPSRAREERDAGEQRSRYLCADRRHTSHRLECIRSPRAVLALPRQLLEAFPSDVLDAGLVDDVRK